MVDVHDVGLSSRPFEHVAVSCLDNLGVVKIMSDPGLDRLQQWRRRRGRGQEGNDDADEGDGRRDSLLQTTSEELDDDASNTRHQYQGVGQSHEKLYMEYWESIGELPDCCARSSGCTITTMRVDTFANRYSFSPLSRVKQDPVSERPRSEDEAHGKNFNLRKNVENIQADDEGNRGKWIGDMYSRPIVLMKVDVEGFEREVLIGAAELFLSACTRPWYAFFEFHTHDYALSTSSECDFAVPDNEPYDTFNIENNQDHLDHPSSCTRRRMRKQFLLQLLDYDYRVFLDWNHRMDRGMYPVSKENVDDILDRLKKLQEREAVDVDVFVVDKYISLPDFPVVSV